MPSAIVSDLETIDVVTLKRLRSDDPGVRILDVRSGGEFETVHIPGSYNVPLDTLGEHIADFAAVESPVVLVCQSGGRATQAHKKLQSAGKSTLHILQGGMNAWTEESGEVTRGTEQRWAMDRQVRLAAGLVAVGGLLASVLVPKAKWVAGGIAAGLTYSAITDTCAVTPMLAKLPYNQTDPCDIEGTLAKLDSPPA